MTTFRCTLLLLALLCQQLSFGKSCDEKDPLPEFYRERSSIEVLSMEAYRSTTQLEGSNPAASEFSIRFRVSQSATLESIDFTVTVNDKTKKLNASDYLSVSTIDWSSFFTGSRIYTLRIPASCDFTVNYKTYNPETIFLSALYRNGGFDSKDYSCTIRLPENLVLTTREGKKFTGETIVFDSTDFAPKQEKLFYLIHPQGTAADQYFSDWFHSRIAPISTIDPSLLPPQLEALNKQGDRTKLAAACFSYVQNEIRYIDIENGIHAIVPRPGNQTIVNKFGDCKDMATLLHSLLKHYGFESYLSVSRTYNKEDTLDFPSIALGNHMIVTLLLDGKPIFLDATETDCLFGDPSLQILGTEVFLINHTGDYFAAVPAVTRYEPKLSLRYHFTKTSNNQMELAARLETSGKLNAFFRHLATDSILSVSNVTAYLETIFRLQLQVTDMHVTDSASVIRFTSILPVSRYNQIGEKHYIDGGFLPDIQSLSEFFSLMPEPTFTARYHLRFSGVQPPKCVAATTEIQTAVPTDGGFSVQFSINGKNSLKEHAPAAFWKQLIAKPFLLTL